MKVCYAKFIPHDFLECHINDAINVLKSMKTSFKWLEELFPRVWELSFYSVLLHDLGKCASGFQRDPRKWGYRHEVLSTPFTAFLDLPGDERNLIALSILTHHRTLDELEEILPGGEHRGEFEEKVEELFQNRDYIEEIFFERVPYWELYFFGRRKDLFNPPNDWAELVEGYDFDPLLSWYERNARKYWSELVFLRGILNASDHLASAGELGVRLLSDIKAAVESRVPPERWRLLQRQAGETEGNLILRAPTGYGKTEASLLWANRNASLTKKGVASRIFYVLPYKASINAMHSRLLALFREPELVGVLHSSSSFYLYSSELEYKRLSSLYRKIYTPLKVTTPFQLMKPFFGVGFPEMGLTELTGSLLIFDEIHAYEPNVLGIILAMLELLMRKKAKTLVMSATMPEFLEELLREVLKPHLLSTPSEEADRFTRHRVNVIDGSMDSIEELLAEVNAHGPVLIACNTISRAMEVYSHLRDRYNSMLLHSRFTYGDREEKEKKLLANLRDYDVVVATQVVEVSLDISFSTIITEPAPLDALIQRFGRVNRRGFGNPRDVYILTTGGEGDRRIYPMEVVRESLKLLEELNGKPLLESRVPELVTRAYEPIADKLTDEVLTYREQALELFNSLKPLKGSESEEQFYEMFQGLEAVPGVYQDRVLELINRGRSIEVHRHLVPVPLWLFRSESDAFHRLSDRGSGKYVLVAELEYSPELGLLREPASGGEVL
ncbi:CRISPR-associated helicase Cas3' [Thermococcus sp. MAR1]|uniref:CRISPR-associated helicase Cas3' n=1 Tax=Thermococcus sp. MAR1 TaxID=1638263 RepID=UPI00143935EA|nr:CRISPR-associated helicase Cas3' [Thermococcus sp. MAR1]NJE09877.1 CRISPR-associated helicase Cas3' [Thermococcus sp. MAR1]